MSDLIGVLERLARENPILEHAERPADFRLEESLRDARACVNSIRNRLKVDFHESPLAVAEDASFFVEYMATVPVGHIRMVFSAFGRLVTIHGSAVTSELESEMEKILEESGYAYVDEATCESRCHSDIEGCETWGVRFFNYL